MNDKGYIEFHLKELLENSGLSKNKFCQRAEIQRSQLNGYMNNTITRLDTDVLIRICFALDRSIADLIEYHKPKKSISLLSAHALFSIISLLQLYSYETD